MKSISSSAAVIFLLLASIACGSSSSVRNKPEPPPITLPAPTDVEKPIVQKPGRISSALRMNSPRATHTATLLSDGRVLVTGGFRQQGTSEVSIASAEIFDPEANTFTPTGEMNEARRGHAAVLLPNGQVLIVGGWGANERTETAELYDPQTGRFNYTGSMFAPRGSMTATLLKNGQVLIAGGDSAKNTPQLIAEIYDPVTNTFAQSGNLNHGRSAHTATLLNDGTVLLIGGRPRYNHAAVLASAEVFDPKTGLFTLTGSMSSERYKHAAVLLQDGNVLVIGGSDDTDWAGKYASVEFYDIDDGTFTWIADLNSERFKLAEAAVLLNNGNVLIGGGNRQIEVFDVQNQEFILSESLDDDYFYTVLTLLKDGSVLITGGYNSSIQPSEQAWIYDSN